jgi:hypothetical protein
MFSDVEARSAAIQFTQRRYFHRLWVLQELAMARQTIVQCGGRSTTWELLQDFLCKILPPKKQPSALKMNMDSEKLLDISGLIQFMKLSESCEALNPLDEVYSLLGLCNSEVRADIPINYSLSVSDLRRRVGALYFSQKAGPHLSSNFTKLPKVLREDGYVFDWFRRLWDPVVSTPLASHISQEWNCARRYMILDKSKDTVLGARGRCLARIDSVVGNVQERRLLLLGRSGRPGYYNIHRDLQTDGFDGLTDISQAKPDLQNGQDASSVAGGQEAEECSVSSDLGNCHQILQEDRAEPGINESILLDDRSTVESIRTREGRPIGDLLWNRNPLNTTGTAIPTMLHYPNATNVQTFMSSGEKSNSACPLCTIRFQPSPGSSNVRSSTSTDDAQTIDLGWTGFGINIPTGHKEVLLKSLFSTGTSLGWGPTTLQVEDSIWLLEGFKGFFVLRRDVPRTSEFSVPTSTNRYRVVGGCFYYDPVVLNNRCEVCQLSYDRQTLKRHGLVSNSEIDWQDIELVCSY